MGPDMIPSRRITGGRAVTSMIVDPFPPGVRPPSMTASILSPIHLMTSCTELHSAAPEELALVAVIG